jgi:hypothetical protein
MKDTLASLEGRLDDVRRRQAWRGIEERLRAQPERTSRRWPWLVVPALALAAAAATLTIATLAHSREPVETRLVEMRIVVPSVPAPVAPPPPASAVAAPPPAASMPIPPPVTPPEVTGARPRRSVARATAQPGATAEPRVPAAGPSAAELYQRAEDALATHDTDSAREHLLRLLRDHPRAKQVDQARYDLALIAHEAGDDAAAAALLETILESGTDAAVRTAAAQLRRRVR